MQTDGNLVITSAAAVVTWNSGTSGHAGAFLYVQNDGNMVIYSTTYSALWNTGTGGM
jgi:hypothetical protein